MDSVDDLRGHWLVCTTSTWDYDVGPLRCGLVRELFRHQQCCGLIAGLGPLTPVWEVGLLHRPATYHAGVQRTRVQSSFVLRIRPADGLSVELEGWTPAYRIDSMGCTLTRCTPPWRSERADVIISAPLQGRLTLSIAVSTVTGRFMLKPDPTTTNYILYLLVLSFASSRGCRGRELGGMIINVYNLLLYNVAATSASLLSLLLY